MKESNKFLLYSVKLQRLLEDRDYKISKQSYQMTC